MSARSFVLLARVKNCLFCSLMWKIHLQWKNSNRHRDYSVHHVVPIDQCVHVVPIDVKVLRLTEASLLKVGASQYLRRFRFKFRNLYPICILLWEFIADIDRILLSLQHFSADFRNFWPTFATTFGQSLQQFSGRILHHFFRPNFCTIFPDRIL